MSEMKGHRDGGHESPGSHSHEPLAVPLLPLSFYLDPSLRAAFQPGLWVRLGDEESLLLASEGLDLFPQSLILTHGIPRRLTRFLKEVLVCCKGHLFATGWVLSQ